MIESPQPAQGGMPFDPHQFMKEGNAPFVHPDMVISTDLPPAMTNLPLSWIAPKGWTEQKGSGLRLATFISEGTDDKIECSIVSLGGMAGGVKANIVRWLGQVKIPIPSDEELEQFLARQEDFESKGHWKGKLLDLTQLQKDEPSSTAGMMAAMIETGEAQIFVKMTGTKAALEKNKTAFRELCASLELKNG